MDEPHRTKNKTPMRTASGDRAHRVLLSGVVWAIGCWFACAGAAQERVNEEAPAELRPVEESRLGSAAFRKGLRGRGLTELLELYLKEFPSRDKTTSLLMLRDLKLSEFSDGTLSDQDRRSAIVEANRILESLIEDRPDDPNRFDWMFTLARSLLYDEAEAYFTSILYRGGTQQERARLIALTTRAVAAASALVKDLALEYERIDTLSIREFERLEHTGYVERLDDLAPKADYLLLWARFYDALPRADADPVRIRRLSAILKTLADLPALVNTAHHVSRVQVQSLLLAGMTCRRLNDHPAARDHLDRALSVADRLDDPPERARIGWAVDLAWIERIRNERDADRFDEALRAHARFRNLIAVGGGDNFGLRLVAALEERSIHQARAARAQRAGRFAQAQRYREEAWQPLARLARIEPGRRDEIYATVYDLIGAGADPATLDPFDKCALITGLLLHADRSTDPADAVLARIVELGERFLQTESAATRTLRPEVLYNVAVALYRQGRPIQAARRFLQVAREHPTFDHALQATTFAVELAAGAHTEPSTNAPSNVGRLYLDALTLLVTRYGDTDAARYWRFFYAQLLQEQGRYDTAAAQYALVDGRHEHHAESGFLRLHCLAEALRRRCGAAAPDLLDVRRRASEFFALHRAFVAAITGDLRRDPNAHNAPVARSLLARARLLAAEAHVLPQLHRPLQALEAVAGFEEAYPAEAALAGRVWRVRLIAYERLGRLDEAAAAIPAYMAVNPDGAGQTLQSLYVDLTAEVERLDTTKEAREAGGKAALALLLAKQICNWAMREGSASSTADRYALRVQLAEATLRAGAYARARDLFASCLESADGAGTGRTSNDLRVALGHAEALFHLGEFAAALPLFHRLTTSLPTEDPIRWKALLRDLRCRTALGHPPEGIIKVIEQQKSMGRNMGGHALADAFEELLRENRRRIGGKEGAH